MWLFTRQGFFSLVEKPGDRTAALLTVRARADGDLDALRAQHLPELGPVQADAGSDYRFRAQAPRSAVARALAAAVEAIDYDNFKHQVALEQGVDRARTYAEVWQALLALEGRS